MRMRNLWIAGMLAACWAAGGCNTEPARGADGGTRAASGARSRVAFAHPLPRLDGNRLKVTVVEVNYGPGESSSPHSHPCPVIGHVVEGALRTQVKGEPEAIYRAGESFYEEPNAVHLVSGNASDEEPARFLAYFICDREEPLSLPASDTGVGVDGGREP